MILISLEHPKGSQQTDCCLLGLLLPDLDDDDHDDGDHDDDIHDDGDHDDEGDHKCIDDDENDI